MKNSSVIAAFDFDHTLTDRDSLLPFLTAVQGKLKTAACLGALIPRFIQFSVGTLSRQEIKEQILSSFLGGRSFDQIKALGEKYAQQQLDKYLKKEALKRLEWHQAQGHRCVLISASLDFYLKPWAERHGFEKVLSSKLEVNSLGLITGKLEGVNCWGPEKVQRLLDYTGSKEAYQLYAYGDSRGDKELLDLADYSFYRKFT